MDAVKGDAQRQIARPLRRPDEMVQHEVQVFLILPGCAYSDDLPIRAVHIQPPILRFTVISAFRPARAGKLHITSVNIIT